MPVDYECYIHAKSSRDHHEFQSKEISAKHEYHLAEDLGIMMMKCELSFIGS